jgi:hypothetical protein
VLPAAVYVTRFSDSYDLLHAGFAIPGAVVLGLLALTLAGGTRKRASLSLGESRTHWTVTTGRFLGVIGLCLAASALVALGVYGLLEYVGSRE